MELEDEEEDIHLPDHIVKEGWDAYPEISEDRVTPLWRLGVWDGPTSGICLVDNAPCYFSWAAELGDDRQRPMLCYKLTDEEWRITQERNRIWVKRVGNHNTFYQHTWARPPAEERELVPGWLDCWDETLALMDAVGKINPTDEQIIGWFMH